MRKILLYTLMTLAAAGMASCEDFLTRDTYDQIGSDEFWKSETDLELYANGFIQKMIPGDGTITRGDIYADYCAVDIPTDLLRPDGNVSPDNQTGWAESNWTNLRRVNYMLDNMHKCKGRVSDEIYNHYEGVARFWRAWFYYDKVQTFGAVPWYDFTIAASDKEAMMKTPRQPRVRHGQSAGRPHLRKHLLPLRRQIHERLGAHQQVGGTGLQVARLPL